MIKFHFIADRCLLKAFASSKVYTDVPTDQSFNSILTLYHSVYYHQTDAIEHVSSFLNVLSKTPVSVIFLLYKKEDHNPRVFIFTSSLEYH